MAFKLRNPVAKKKGKKSADEGAEEMTQQLGALADFPTGPGFGYQHFVW